MSRNIAIQEGGSARRLTVDKLRTRLADGGSCLWVPEDEVQLTTKPLLKTAHIRPATMATTAIQR